MPGNLLRPFTLHGFAVCDQADVFVFLCGVSAQLAYGRRFDRNGWWQAASSALRRVRTIYLAQIALIAAMVGIVLAGHALGLQDVDRFVWLGSQGAPTPAAVLSLLCLAAQPGMLAILPLYMALLSWFALVLLLVRRPLLLLALSAALWVAVHLDPAHVRVGPVFNAAAWQLTFTLGVLSCRYVHVLHRLPPWPLDLAAVAVLAAGAWAVLTLPNTWEAYDALGLPLRLLLRGRSKGDLDPGRVLSVLALAWLTFRLVPRGAPWLHARPVSVLTGLGQRSLPVFAVGVLASGLGTWALAAAHGGAAVEVAVNAASFAALVGATHLPRRLPWTFSWRRPGPREGGRIANLAPAAAASSAGSAA